MSDKIKMAMLIVCLVLLGVSVAGWFFMDWNVSRNVSQVLDRAQVASSAEDMVYYLTVLKCNMQGYGMTEGHAAFIFKSPANDMSAAYQAVERSEGRLMELLDVDTSTEQGAILYDTRLDDVRGSLRELEIPDFAFWWRGSFLGIVVTYSFWVLLIIFLVLLFSI